jgi:hypothetical protein
MLRNLRAATLVAASVLTLAATTSAQWLTQPTAGIPRLPDGKPNLSAPAPRSADGKPDLSGLWHAGPKWDTDFKETDVQQWAQEQARQRLANPASLSWSVLCLPPGPMVTFSGPLKIIQTPQIVAVLYEVPNNFRQIFLDGRGLPKDPNPTWQGYSVGRWEGETLVVESNGFNDKSWVGRPGYPHTEALRVTERYSRRDFGHMDVQITFDDLKTFARSWTATTELLYDPDTEMLEYVCNENEKSVQHFVQPQPAPAIAVDVASLGKFAGVYQMMTPRGMANATVTVDGGQLMIDVPGFGSGRMVPQSATMFQFRGAVLEFVSNEKGDVTHLIAHVVEGDFKGPRIK